MRRETKNDFRLSLLLFYLIPPVYFYDVVAGEIQLLLNDNRSLTAKVLAISKN